MMNVRGRFRATTIALGAIAALSMGAQEKTPPQQTRRDLGAWLRWAAAAGADEQALDRLDACVWLGEERLLAATFRADVRETSGAAARVQSAPALLEPLTSIALLRLCEQRSVGLAEPLVKHLPELDPLGDRITLAQALTHTSGLTGMEDWVATSDRRRDLASALAWLATRPLDAEPGSCFAHSSSNALIVAALVERMTEKPLPQALSELVLTPAGMTSTELAAGPPRREWRRSEAATRGICGDATLVAELLDVARVTTTLEDCARFLRAIESADLLTEPARATFFGAGRTPEGVETACAFGFARSRLDRAPLLTFGGAAERGALYVAWRPETSLIVALGAGAPAARLAPLAERLARIVLEERQPEIIDLPLDAAQRALYVGVYYMGCTRTTVEERGEALFFQSPYEGPYRLRFQGAHRFVAAHDDGVEFEFVVEYGRASAFIYSNHGAHSGGRRVE